MIAAKFIVFHQQLDDMKFQKNYIRQYIKQIIKKKMNINKKSKYLFSMLVEEFLINTILIGAFWKHSLTKKLAAVFV